MYSSMQWIVFWSQTIIDIQPFPNNKPTAPVIQPLPVAKIWSSGGWKNSLWWRNNSASTWQRRANFEGNSATGDASNSATERPIFSSKLRIFGPQRVKFRPLTSIILTTRTGGISGSLLTTVTFVPQLSVYASQRTLASIIYDHNSNAGRHSK